ncbi:MAG: hypothetical protein ACYS4W_03085 [Planctomycetota bacterium]
MTSMREAAEAEKLVASNTEAAEIHKKIRSSLAPLEALKSETCPDELVEGTIWRARSLARSSQRQLQKLIADEQAKGFGAKNHVWKSLTKIAVAAAVILIVLGTWSAPLDLIRHKYRQHQCNMQLVRIFRGLSNYIADHDGRMPAVASAAGAPWWKVGYQGEENHSATRSIWLLVKGDYANPADFVCPGKRQKLKVRFEPRQLQSWNDFPARSYITYSVRIMCDKSKSKGLRRRKVLIADVSPLFENLPDDFSKPFKLVLDEALLTLNSSNHGRRGQNVLFCDGSIKFLKERHADISYDDIFTLREMHLGSEIQGCEVPSCETDSFLAP